MVVRRRLIPAADCLATVEVSGSVTTMLGDLDVLLLLGDKLDEEIEGDEDTCLLVVPLFGVLLGW